jgi:hypothetical protein
MSVIYLANVRAARAARNLAESLSSDPMVRYAARVRAIAAIARREQRWMNPQPAEVIYLDTRIAELRASLRRSNRRRPRLD